MLTVQSTIHSKQLTTMRGSVRSKIILNNKNEFLITAVAAVIESSGSLGNRLLNNVVRNPRIIGKYEDISISNKSYSRSGQKAKYERKKRGR